MKRSLARALGFSVLLLSACGPAMPGSELLGQWRADLTASLTAQQRAELASSVLSVTFNGNSTYVLSIQATATATAMQAPGCQTTVNSTGGTWSVSAMSGVNTLTTGGTVTGTVERSNCRNGADNIARRAATDQELFVLRSGNYTVNGNTMVFTPSGSTTGSVTFTR